MNTADKLDLFIKISKLYDEAFDFGLVGVSIKSIHVTELTFNEITKLYGQNIEKEIIQGGYLKKTIVIDDNVELFTLVLLSKLININDLDPMQF
jgi:hypothetical protein